MARKTKEEIEYVFTADTSGVDSGASKVARALGRTDKAADKADKSLKKTGNSMEGMKFAAQGAGGKIGELAGRAENFGRSFGMLGAVGGPIAGVAVVLAGVGLAAVATGVAVVKGTVMATEAIVSLTRGAADAIEKFKEFEGTPLGFTQEQIDRIERANDGLDGTVFAASRLEVELASNVAPTVGRVSILVGALALGATDAFKSMTQGADALGAGLDSAGKAYAAVMGPQIMMVRAQRALNNALGLNSDHLDITIQRMEGWRAVMAAGATQLDSYTGTSMQGYIDQSVQIANAVGELTEAEDARTASIDSAAAALERQAKALRLLEIAKGEAKRDNDTDKQALVDAQSLLSMKEANAAASLASATATDTQTKAEGNYRNAAQQTANVVAALPGLFKEGSKAAAVASQASNYVQAVYNTANAVTAALTAGPILGPILAGVTAGLGAAQIATIATTAPPAFASGGIMSASNAPLYPQNGPGERLASITPGEGIFTRDQMQAMGGGAGSQAPIVIDLKMSNRTVSRSTIRDRSKTRGVRRSSDPVTA